MRELRGLLGLGLMGLGVAHATLPPDLNAYTVLYGDYRESTSGHLKSGTAFSKDLQANASHVNHASGRAAFGDLSVDSYAFANKTPAKSVSRAFGNAAAVDSIIATGPLGWSQPIHFELHVSLDGAFVFKPGVGWGNAHAGLVATTSTGKETRIGWDSGYKNGNFHKEWDSDLGLLAPGQKISLNCVLTSDALAPLDTTSTAALSLNYWITTDLDAFDPTDGSGRMAFNSLGKANYLKSSSVPEPASWLVLMAPALGLIARRKRN